MADEAKLVCIWENLDDLKMLGISSFLLLDQKKRKQRKVKADKNNAPIALYKPISAV